MKWRWAIIGTVALGLASLVGFSAGCEHRDEREVKITHKRPGHETHIVRKTEIKRDERGRHKEVEVKEKVEHDD